MTTQSPEQAAIIDEARMHYHSLLGSFQSLILGTADAEGEPDASYAPAVIDEDRNLYIYISGLSRHTGNIRATGRASALIIEDESLAGQLFARMRVTYACRAECIERGSSTWEAQMSDFTDKFGRLMHHLKTMEDFDLFKLVPQEGRLVTGFGRAFDLSGPRMEVIEHVRGNGGKGHVHKN